MTTQNVFKRHELKYMLTTAQYQTLQQAMVHHMVLDQFGKHSIHNVYFDTEDYLLIRRSIEKPCYKEKLRVRSYGTPSKGGSVFVEVKKKYQGIVYKRRLELPRQEAYRFLLEDIPLKNPSQISKEISYFMKMYGNLKPMVAIHYEREAFFGQEDNTFRMTFDHDIRMNRYQDSATTPILDKGFVLLEVKTSLGIPSWLLSFFSEQEIFKTSFSKYGTAYQNFLLPNPQPTHSTVKSDGGTINVA